MTVKTLLIAIGLILGFAGFMTLAWDISAWMMDTPVANVEPAPQKPPSGEKSQTDAAEQGNSAKIRSTKDTKANHSQPAQSGAYDDSWTGSEETKTSNGLKPSLQIQEKSIAPVTADPVADHPYAPDDREVGEQTGSVSPSDKKADPYSVDDREAR